MPKAKLKLEGDQFAKLPYAARIADVKVGTAEKVAKKIHVEVNFKTPSDLVEMGGIMATVTDAELKAYNEAEKKKADAKAAKQAV